MSHDTRIDEELFELMRQGDQQAFCDLYHRLNQQIYQFALHMSGSSWIAEDVTQEVFVFLMEQKDKFDPARGSLRYYLFGIARHRIWRALRSSTRESVPQHESDLMTNRKSADPFAEISKAETIRLVQSAVLSLPRPYREVVVLIELQEMTYSEVSSILNCAVGTIRSRLHRARSLLLEKIKRMKSQEQQITARSGGNKYEMSTI